jgi:hypothetical protein
MYFRRDKLQTRVKSESLCAINALGDEEPKAEEIQG